MKHDKKQVCASFTIQALVLKLNNVKLCFHPQNPTVLMVSFFCLCFIYTQHCTPKTGQSPIFHEQGNKQPGPHAFFHLIQNQTLSPILKKIRRTSRNVVEKEYVPLWFYDRSHKNILNTAFPKVTNIISDIFMYDLD